MDETYQENEKVLVHHQNRIYEAKIIKIESKKNDKKKLQYFIHYLGWKEKWNEWIDSNKILKLTEKNKEYQKKVNNKAAGISNSNSKKTNNNNKKIKQEIIKQQQQQYDSENSDDGENEEDEENEDDENSNGGGEGADDEDGEDNMEDAGEDAENSEHGSTNEDAASPRSTTSSSSNTSSSSSSKNNKRKRNEISKQQIKYIDIEIPISLKNKLVDDWNLINNEKSILSLPRSPNVKDIFSKIVEENEKHSSSSSSSLSSTSEYKEVINGIIQYFNKALGSLLLYRFERPQYDTILKHNQNKPMSDIYGAEHLLRLFVKLPHLLVVSNLEEKTIIQIKEVLNKVMEYLEKNITTLFSKEYSVAPSPYLKAASSN